MSLSIACCLLLVACDQRMDPGQQVHPLDESVPAAQRQLLEAQCQAALQMAIKRRSLLTKQSRDYTARRFLIAAQIHRDEAHRIWSSIWPDLDRQTAWLFRVWIEAIDAINEDDQQAYTRVLDKLAILALDHPESTQAAQALFLRGRLAETMGEEQQAILAFMQVTTAHPDHPLARTSLLRVGGLLRRQARAAEPEQAELWHLQAGAIWEQVASRYPLHADTDHVRLLAGRAYLQARSWQRCYDNLQPLASRPGPRPGKAGDLHAEAMYWSARAFVEMQEQEDRGEQVDSLRGMYTTAWSQAAFLLFTRIDQEYPYNKWAKYSRAHLESAETQVQSE